MSAVFAPLSVVFVLPMFALSTAQMDLPGDFYSQATKLSVAGFGGKNKGAFRFAGYSGEFTRGESRLGIFDPLYVSSKGKSSFTLRRADGSDVISAECAMKKSTVTIGIVTFDPKKMAYQCDFRENGRLSGARFVLGHQKASDFKQTFQAYDRRAGEANIAGHYLTMQSVHNYKGTKLGSPSPVGYLIMFGDQTVAAVELTDVNPTFLLSPDLDESLKQSVLVTALSLAVLRDPANSALED